MDTALSAQDDVITRFRRPTVTVIAVSVLLYLAYALARGLDDTATELAHFRWPLFLPVLGLALVNYAGRFLKWAYFLRHLGIRIPWTINAWIYVAGLGMSVTPGKAGEVIKPWAVRAVTGTPMATTVPALIADRFTDAVAVVGLAAMGVATYAPQRIPAVLATFGALLGVVAVVSMAPLGNAFLAVIRAIPGVRRAAPVLSQALTSLRTCLGPGPLVVSVAISLVAWFAECLCMKLVLDGLGVSADLAVSTFLYTFAMLFGAPSPGGVGMTELAMVEGAMELLPAITAGQAVAMALLVRVASLWFGVALGALALLTLDGAIRRATPA